MHVRPNFSTPAFLDRPSSSNYLVKKGDNLSTIARRHGMSLQQLVAMNPQLEGRNLDLIYPGEELNLTGANIPAPDKKEVQQGPQKSGGMGFGGLAGMLGKKMPPLQETEGFKNLPSALQGRVETLAQGHRGGYVRSLIGSKNFQTLSDEAKAKALDVQEAVPQQSLHSFGKLFAGEEGQAKIFDKDQKDNTLLDNLHGLSQKPLAGEFAKNGVSRADLLGDVVRETENPGASIAQHDRGTCTVTSLQYNLARRNPAEYARLMTGLSSPKGEVEMANGDTLKRDAGSEAPDSATKRSNSSRVFQSAMMEYANGDLFYDNKVDSHSRSDTGAVVAEAEEGERTGSGLYDYEYDRANAALFGESKLYQGKGSDMFEHLEGVKPGEAVVALKWSENGDKHKYHAVSFEKIEDGRIYFRNPWGKNHMAPGTQREPPPRLVEDGWQGLESMSLEDMGSRIEAVSLSKPKTDWLDAFTSVDGFKAKFFG